MNETLSTAVMIPARYGAERLPGKPLLMLNGRELIAHVIDRCREAFRDELPIIVATDDERIAHIADRESVQAIMTPVTCPNGTVRIHKALLKLKKSGQSFDKMIHIQGDEPLLTPAMLHSLRRLIDRTDVELATLVAPLRPQDLSDPSVVKAQLEGDRAVKFSRQSLPHAWGHLGVYAWKCSALEKYLTLTPTPGERAEKLEQLRWIEHGNHIHAEVSESMPRGVNTPEDVATVQALLVERRKQSRLGGDTA